MPYDASLIINPMSPPVILKRYTSLTIFHCDYFGRECVVSDIIILIDFFDVVMENFARQRVKLVPIGS